MIAPLQPLMLLDSAEARCRELGDYLGLGEPVEEAVLLRAQEDDRFALHLLMSRGHRHLLQLHLDDARNEAYRRHDASPSFSNAALVGRMATAALKWARSGFRGLDQGVAEARFAQCQACPHLVEAPPRLLYRVNVVSKADPRVCAQCGCVASRKVGIATERCPLGRWEAAH